MSGHRIITLTTDFGYKDPFVAEVKGVILSINPDAVLIDVTHSIEPQNVEEAAYVIGSIFSWFPLGTIHLVVVDPGVGSLRKGLILEAGGHYFVGPDNGAFSHIVHFYSPVKGTHIAEEKYMLSEDSPTFQGRDLFAPAAAWLSKGLRPEEFGPTVKDFVTLPIRQPEVTTGSISGEIFYLDHFGNAITNIKSDALAAFGNRCNVEVKDRVIPMVRYYVQAEENDLCCLVNSSGYLELFVNKGSAAERYGLKKGDKVVVSH